MQGAERTRGAEPCCVACGRALPAMPFLPEPEAQLEFEAEDAPDSSIRAVRALLALCRSQDPELCNVGVWENTVEWLLGHGPEARRRTLGHPSVVALGTRYVRKFSCAACYPVQFATACGLLAEIWGLGASKVEEAVALEAAAREAVQLQDRACAILPHLCALALRSLDASRGVLDALECVAEF